MAEDVPAHIRQQIIERRNENRENGPAFGPPRNDAYDPRPVPGPLHTSDEDVYDGEMELVENLVENDPLHYDLNRAFLAEEEREERGGHWSMEGQGPTDPESSDQGSVYDK